MIGWLNPAALWALPLAAAPILIHLLRTHHATRVAFPSLRFVPPSRTAAVRLRLPSDVALMLVRVAIIALSIGALAGPIVLTAARTAAWNSRTARAVVVDASDSMRVPDATGVAPASAAAEGATAELQSATYGVRIDARDLRQGIARASTWLAASPPARREVVVISDVQRGRHWEVRGSNTLPMADGIGLRFVPVGQRAETSRFEGARLLGAGDVASREQAIEVTADTTAVTLQANADGASRGVATCRCARLGTRPRPPAARARDCRYTRERGGPADRRPVCRCGANGGTSADSDWMDARHRPSSAGRSRGSIRLAGGHAFGGPTGSLMAGQSAG